MHLEFCAWSIAYGRRYPKTVSCFTLIVQTKGFGGKFKAKWRAIKAIYKKKASKHDIEGKFLAQIISQQLVWLVLVLVQSDGAYVGRGWC